MNTDVGGLQESLSRLTAKHDMAWYSALGTRKQAEAEHHDHQRDQAIKESLPQDTYELLHGNKKFYSTTRLSTEYLDQWMRAHVPGKVVLDFACGNGSQVIKAARLGARLAVGIDISRVSVENARRAAREAAVDDRCEFVVGDCENTELPAGSIDVVLCTGVLHHMDLSYAFPEIRRVLKPGGKAIAVEALDYNPLIKAYRKMTPAMRTEWEKNHILSLKDVQFAKRFFNVQNVKFWHLFSVFAAFFRRSEAVFGVLLRVGNVVDKAIMEIPLLRRMAWQFTFEMQKPVQES